MSKTFKDKAVNFLGYLPLLFVGLYLWMSLFVHPAFVVPFVLYSHQTFKGTMDLVQGVGPVYWIIRRDQRMFSIGKGTMHELSAPWRKGIGIYFVLSKRCLQIGLCKKQQLGETDGILSAIQGRYLEVEPKEIGNWNGVQKETNAFKATA